MRPNRLIAIGFVLLALGAVLPFLMVIQVIPEPLWLSFVAFGCTVAGSFLGFLGLAESITEHRRRDDGMG